MLIGKSDRNSDNYDTLYFVSRDVEELYIPSFIKYIKPYAFSDILNLLNLTFPEDSELVSLDKNAFYSFGAESIQIPGKVEELKDGWCTSTIFLVNVSISPLNKNFAFLPDQEKIMVAKSNNDDEIFDVITLALRDIKKAFIPNYIKYINSGAFCDCEKLECIEFENDSQLQYLGENSLSRINITNICLPYSLKSTGSFTFLRNDLLYCVEGLSDVFSFGKGLFNYCNILSIVSFPNALRLHFVKNVSSFSPDPQCIVLYVHANSIID